MSLWVTIRASNIGDRLRARVSLSDHPGSRGRVEITVKVNVNVKVKVKIKVKVEVKVTVKFTAKVTVEVKVTVRVGELGLGLLSEHLG